MSTTKPNTRLRPGHKIPLQPVPGRTTASKEKVNQQSAVVTQTPHVVATGKAQGASAGLGSNGGCSSSGIRMPSTAVQTATFTTPKKVKPVMRAPVPSKLAVSVQSPAVPQSKILQSGTIAKNLRGIVTTPSQPRANQAPARSATPGSRSGMDRQDSATSVQSALIAPSANVIDVSAVPKLDVETATVQTTLPVLYLEQVNNDLVSHETPAAQISHPVSAQEPFFKDVIGRLKAYVSAKEAAESKLLYLTEKMEGLLLDQLKLQQENAALRQENEALLQERDNDKLIINRLQAAFDAQREKAQEAEGWLVKISKQRNDLMDEVETFKREHGIATGSNSRELQNRLEKALQEADSWQFASDKKDTKIAELKKEILATNTIVKQHEGCEAELVKLYKENELLKAGVEQRMNTEGELREKLKEAMLQKSNPSRR